MKLKLDQLEVKLQALVENQLVGILPGLKIEDRVIQRLANALKQNIIQQQDDGAIAPDVFTLIVATDASPMWKEQRTLDALKSIITTQETMGTDIHNPADHHHHHRRYLLSGWKSSVSHTSCPVADTQGTQTSLTNESAEINDNIPENAF
jgi:hypothetical protein